MSDQHTGGLAGAGVSIRLLGLERFPFAGLESRHRVERDYLDIIVSLHEFLCGHCHRVHVLVVPQEERELAKTVAIQAFDDVQQ